MKVKENIYALSLSQINSLVEGEMNLLANFSNVSAVLKQNHDFLWVGFYFVDKQELVLGPFQGPVACTRISKGRGVCGTSWKERKILNVPNVLEFSGHITCSEQSKSEIVIPIFNKNKEVFAVLDVDSEKIANFDNIDEKYLAQLANVLMEKHG